MSNALLEVLAARWLIPAATIVSIAVIFFLPTIQRHIALWRLPLVGKGKWDSKTRLVKYLTSCEQVYDEGYRQFQAGVFRVTSNMGEIVTNCVRRPEVLERAQQDARIFVQFPKRIQELMMVKYTKVEATALVIIHTVKSRLTPSLAKLSGYLGDEVRRALTDELPDCSDWTDVHLSEKLIRVVSRVSGRVFVGANVCRSEEYIDHTINYTRDVMLGAHAVGQVKQWLRPLRASSLPEIRQLNRRRKLAADFFMPVVRERIEKSKQEKPEDLLQWLIDMQATKYGDTSASELTKKQLDISFAAIHTTNAVALNTIYTLAAMPRVQAEIREEVRTVLAENKGQSEFSAVQKMKKLDSFIRESVRCYPIGAVAFRNKTLKAIVLSDGIVLPEGIIVETAVSAVDKDPALFDDPETFDHLRFYSSPKKVGDTAVESMARKSMVTVGLDSLLFGYGKHACPGRFFAVHEIKAIIAEILMRFEFTNAGDFPGRYPNLKHGAFFEPDRSKHLFLKKIES